MRACLLASMLTLGACGTAAPADPPLETRLAAADARAVAAFPEGLSARAAAVLPTDASGWIGRNRAWGGFFSSRFQRGAGTALRTALASDRRGAAVRAFRAIEVVAEAVEADGRIPSTLPPDVGGRPFPTDVASGAAFALGDLCLGWTALDAAVRAAPPAAGRWLLTQEALLLDADARRAADGAADRFARAAPALQAADGYLVEAGGHDTSCQGATLLVGEDLALAGTDGRIDSSGNTRTCGGGETVGGVPKRLAVTDAFAGLVYAGVRADPDSLLAPAARVEARALQNSGVASCVPRSG